MIVILILSEDDFFCKMIHEVVSLEFNKAKLIAILDDQKH